MDVIKRRRMLLMQQEINTTPIIKQNNICLSNNPYAETKEKQGWFITKHYNVVNSPAGKQTIKGFIGEDDECFCCYFEPGTTNIALDYYFFNGSNQVEIEQAPYYQRKLSSVVFSVQLSRIDDSYAYLVETGQIFFAGENTPYYGHYNISELN